MVFIKEIDCFKNIFKILSPTKHSSKEKNLRFIINAFKGASCSSVCQGLKIIVKILFVYLKPYFGKSSAVRKSIYHCYKKFEMIRFLCQCASPANHHYRKNNLSMFVQFWKQKFTGRGSWEIQIPHLFRLYLLFCENGLNHPLHTLKCKTSIKRIAVFWVWH